MSSFWRNFNHWLHWKLSFWQLPVQPVMKISSKWRHFRFSVMMCLLWVQVVIYNLPQPTQQREKNHVILDRVITALVCIWSLVFISFANTWRLPGKKALLRPNYMKITNAGIYLNQCRRRLLVHLFTQTNNVDDYWLTHLHKLWRWILLTKNYGRDNANARRHPPARPPTYSTKPRSPLELQGKNYSTLHQTFISSHFE